MTHSPSDPRAHYVRYLTALNERRFGELSLYYAESLLVNGIHRDLEDHLADLERILSVSPDFHWQLEDLLIDGNKLAVRPITTGTHEGQYADLPPTHRRITAAEFAHYRLTNGKFTELWFLADRDSVKQQLTT
jgi:predicted ester cyclase